MRRVIIVLVTLGLLTVAHLVLRPTVAHHSTVMVPSARETTDAGSPEDSGALVNRSQKPSSMTQGGYFVNQEGEACLKLVVISYQGAVTWLKDVASALPPKDVSQFVPGQGADGWTVSSLTTTAPSIRLDGHPVRLFWFAHEGIGFIGQPRSAKEVVYANARAVIALGEPNQIEGLKSVLSADFQSLTRATTRVEFFGFSPPPPGTPQGASPPDALHEWVDWKKHPMRVIEVVFERLFARTELSGARHG